MYNPDVKIEGLLNEFHSIIEDGLESGIISTEILPRSKNDIVVMIVEAFLWRAVDDKIEISKKTLMRYLESHFRNVYLSTKDILVNNK
jgi:hypothetical protein